MKRIKLISTVFAGICFLLLCTIGMRACKTSGQIMDRTMDGDNVIFQYEWFKQQNEDYKAILVKIERSKTSLRRFRLEAGNRKGWTFEDKEEYSRLGTISSGFEDHAEDIKSKYNARSKMINRKIFKDNSLPNTLN